MSRLLGRAAAWAGWALLGALAATGLGLSAVAGLAASPVGRPLVAGLVVRQVDATIAGRVELEAVEVLPQGGIELRGVSVFSPEERLVLQVSRMRLFPDLTRLAGQQVGVVLELQSPSVLLEDEEGGGVSLARAFAPAHPAPPEPEKPDAPPALPSWTFRLTRLTVRNGDLWWQRLDGATAAEVTGLDADAEGSYGPAGGFLGLRVRASVSSPVEGPVALDLVARRRGNRLDVPVLKASLGPTDLAATGRLDLATLAFRAAVTRLGVGTATVRKLAPAAVPGGDLAGSAYAESDGLVATAALLVAPEGPGDGAAARGSARLAAAARLRPPTRALGFDVRVDALDPSRLLAQAPPGRLTVAASGGVAGNRLADLRGRVALELAPSRLRAGTLGPISFSARAERGLVEVSRLDARLPGLVVTGGGRWQEAGPVGGELDADADDLGRLGRDLADLTGVALPPLAGQVRVHASLAGTAAAPEARASIDAPHLAAGQVKVDGTALSAEAVGPLERLRAKVTGGVARATAGDVEGRTLKLQAEVAGGEARLSFSGLLPSLGQDPVIFQARARLAPDRKGADVAELAFGWPGVRWVLVHPAAVTFSPARVDRLELVDGERRLALSGGLGENDALDARLEATRLELARLPRGLLPADLGLRGALSLDARLAGTTRRPVVAAHLALADAEVHGFTGLQLLGDVGWDGTARRLTADLGLLRAAGGSIDLTADLPLPLTRAKGAEPVSLSVAAAGWPVELLRQAAGLAAPLSGTLDANLALEGTVAAPTGRVALTLDEARLEELGPLGASAALELDGDTASLKLAGRYGGAALLDLAARLPFDLPGLLQRPEATLRALPRAPLAGTLEVPGLELATVSGKAGLPEGLAGTLRASAILGGTAVAPRGTATVSLAGLEVAGHRDLSGRVELSAEPLRTALVVRLSAAGVEALLLDGSLGAPPERLLEPAMLRTAPLSLEVVVPGLPLGLAAGRALPVDGRLTAKLTAQGTLARPEGRIDLGGTGLVIDGRPLGDLVAVARYQAPTGTVELSLKPTTGGVLWAGGTLAVPLGIDLTAAQLRRAPTSLRITSDRLDLGFLPAVAPGLVRVASGPLTVDLTAAGPLEALVPQGKVELEGGRIAVVELGDWSDLALSATLGDRTFEVSRLEARRGKGTLSGHLSLRRAADRQATLAGRIDFRRFTISRAGMDLVNLELPVELAGTMTDELLDATITIPGGTVRLPEKSPRQLQPLEARPDVQVGEPKAKRPSWFDAPAAAGGPATRPFEARCRVVIPDRVAVLGENPAMDLQLKADVTLRVVDGDLFVTGPVEVVKGKVEPIAGRIFNVERGRVTFPGAGLPAGQLDVTARYDNPAAVVTVSIGGTVSKPSIQLASRPVMDQGAIAMLIATGRTEIKANTSSISSVSGKETESEGKAGTDVALSLAFQGLVSDKLPVDQVSLDSTTLRAGKYLTDKIFIGYARRWDAKRDQGENENEVKAEFKLTPRWNFELRYGDAQSGDASVIWSRDY